MFHDIEGLIELMGGDTFTSKLDEVFDMPPKFDDSYYGFTIHEIREMQIVNMEIMLAPTDSTYDLFVQLCK